MDAQVEAIRENYDRIQEQIQVAAQSAGRDAAVVRLVVVTKAQPVEVVQAAIQAGACCLGENYPEETVPKIEQLGRPPGVEWHMIGHLQSRKAALVVEHFDMLHSLDSLRLAERLDRLIGERSLPRKLPVLLEFNVGGEESKFGWSAASEQQWATLLPEIESLLQLPHLEVQGLMTMPPLFDDPEESRPFFVKLRKLAEFFNRRVSQPAFHEFSMGTSSDFAVAVQEGATLVRVGQAIVGPRPTKV